MGAISPLHLILILAVALLVIGPGKLPETGAALGKAMREFREAMNGMDPEPAAAMDPQPAALPAPAPSATPPQAPTQVSEADVTLEHDRG